MSQAAPIRWRKDTGWEFRCGDCARAKRTGGRFWPLSREFWDFQAMTRCKACWAARTKRQSRERYVATGGYSVHRKEWARTYRLANGDRIRYLARQNYAKRRARLLEQAA